MATIAPNRIARTLVVNSGDDLVVALSDIAAGHRVLHGGREYTPSIRIPGKHKFAARDVRRGERVRMYGVTVGIAQDDIPAGGLITTQNLRHATDTPTVKPTRKTDWQRPDVSRFTERTFAGYHRGDGRVGTANHWLVIPLVFCENRNIEAMRQAMIAELGFASESSYRKPVRNLVESFHSGASPAQLLDAPFFAPAAPGASRVFENVDGIKFLTHTQGCGESREDSTMLCGLLAGYIDHPNVAGATVLSLGCQIAQIGLLRKKLHERNPKFDKPLIILEQQQVGSEPDLLAQAIKRTFVGLIEADKARRSPTPLSKLTVGVKCGGSDGFSGISANPAMGHCADMLVALGGSIILAEFPECHGVEQELADRCVDTDKAQRFLELMRAYNDRAQAVGTALEYNPSPGNIADGLITDAMKSAGAVRKAGASPVVDVLDYPEPVTRAGVNLLCTPGSDVECTTAMAGSGAQLIVFSTGLGTPTGNAIAPTLKISTNTALARRMHDIIDYDAGPILTGALTIEHAGQELLDLVISTASGQYTPHAVRLNQDDFIPWRRGVSL